MFTSECDQSYPTHGSRDHRKHEKKVQEKFLSEILEHTEQTEAGLIFTLKTINIKYLIYTLRGNAAFEEMRLLRKCIIQHFKVVEETAEVVESW